MLIFCIISHRDITLIPSTLDCQLFFCLKKFTLTNMYIILLLYALRFVVLGSELMFVV